MDFRLNISKPTSPGPQAVRDPQEGLRRLIDRAPEAEQFAEQTIDRLRPGLNWLHRFRRRLATGAVAAISAWLFVHVMFGANGMVVYRQKKAEYLALQKEIGGLQKESDHRASDIEALKSDPKTIVKEAREHLGYTKPGEYVFVQPQAPPPPPPKNISVLK